MCIHTHTTHTHTHNYVLFKSFIIQDLAARNVLVSKEEVCKIADFGLSRETVDNAYDVKTVRKQLLNIGAPLSCDRHREGKSLFGGQPLRLYSIASSLLQVTCGVLECCCGR